MSVFRLSVTVTASGSYTSQRRVYTQLQTKQLAPLLPKDLPLPLRLAVRSNRTQLVEVSPEYIKESDTQKKVIETTLEKYKRK